MMRTSLSLATALVAGVLLAAPAHAERTVSNDAIGDGRLGTDFTKVVVKHAPKRVRIKTRVVEDPSGGDRLPDEVWHLIDTQGDRKPEFLVFVIVANELDDHPAVFINPLDGWPSKQNPYEALKADNVDCGLHNARVKDGGHLLRTTIGRGCLAIDGDKPDRLRVNTFGTREDGSYADIVKGWKKYGMWVTDD